MPQQIGIDIFLEIFFDLKWIVFLIYVDYCGKGRKTEGTTRRRRPQRNLAGGRTRLVAVVGAIVISFCLILQILYNPASPVPRMVMVYKNATVDVRPFYSKQTQD